MNLPSAETACQTCARLPLMVEPVSIATGVAKVVGPRVAKEVIKWARGSEARQLVNLLKQDHPAAPSLLLQPDALGELWFYAETGELDYDAMLAAVRPVTKSEVEAEAMVEAIRTTQWRVMRGPPLSRAFESSARRLTSRGHCVAFASRRPDGARPRAWRGRAGRSCYFAVGRPGPVCDLTSKSSHSASCGDSGATICSVAWPSSDWLCGHSCDGGADVTALVLDRGRCSS